MPDKWPLANGNWSNAANWNGGTKPVAGDDVFADGRTLNVDESFNVATLRTTQRSGGTIGGSFVFNTAGVTGTVTSSSPLVPGATNLIQVTATTGTVTISLGGDVSPSQGNNVVLILHSGNCNLNLNGNNFSSTQIGTPLNNDCISKTSLGTLTITGNLINLTGGGTCRCLISTSGNTVIIGNVIGGLFSGFGNVVGIQQSSGTLTITGNVTGGNVLSSNVAILFSGISLIVNGIVTGGIVANAISSTGTTNTITGNVTAGTVAAISSTTANIINVSGTVTASATSQAISMTNANGQVYLNGNMVNNNGKMAIYAPIVWLDANNTTSAAFFTSGGSPRTLYSEDTFPNMPAESNTKFNTVYGPGGGLRGTLRMPAAADTRNGVVYDNGTIGTALFTTSLFLTELSSSTVPVAVRMQNLCTPMILGELMEAFKK
jgi:hypothetical protein